MNPHQTLGALSQICPLIQRSHLESAWAFPGLDFQQLVDRVGLESQREIIFKFWRSDRFKKWERWRLESNTSLAVWGGTDYPEVLLGVPEAPNVLWFKGHPSWVGRPLLAIVGSREPSSDALQWMQWHLARALCELRVGVVSGGARGIDQRAHWISVEQSLPTLSLMPVGLMQRYPPAFCEYEDAILETRGAVVSHFPPDMPLHKVNFIQRNRVIAALSRIVFVVEARRRSGSLLTAYAAANLGITVCTIPVSAISTVGQGNLDLLSEGATIIRDSEDLKVAWALG
jgi:DNA processing protein